MNHSRTGGLTPAARQGYSSPPTASVPGFNVTTKVGLSFGKKFETNGAVAAITLLTEKKE
ncbi:MAG TPA: hypothetical protein VG055_24350 [Planctomycetaceae bacterium]|jgi:hypothetical protein|nr:hypothetical protein [Planctomycetaceae bacterium]